MLPLVAFHGRTYERLTKKLQDELAGRIKVVVKEAFIPAEDGVKKVHGSGCNVQATIVLMQGEIDKYELVADFGGKHSGREPRFYVWDWD